MLILLKMESVLLLIHDFCDLLILGFLEIISNLIEEVKDPFLDDCEALITLKLHAFKVSLCC